MTVVGIVGAIELGLGRQMQAGPRKIASRKLRRNESVAAAVAVVVVASIAAASVSAPIRSCVRP